MKHKILLICTMLTIEPDSATELQSLEKIKIGVMNYIQTNILNINQGKPDIQVGNIDSRLKLAACPENNIKIINPYNRRLSDISTLVVQCGAKRSWKIYIPIQINYNISVVVAKRFLSRGKHIKAEDIVYDTINTRRLKRGYIKEMNSALGMVCTKNIAKGQVIKPGFLKQAKLIHKGDKVYIVAAHPRIKIRMKGMALSSGSLGEIIQVRNLSSETLLEAKVVNRQEVRVNI